MTHQIPPLSADDLSVRAADWHGFSRVMGDKGGCGGCWCMLWRLSKKDMDAGMGEPNRQSMKAVFDRGDAPGLVAWHGNEAIGWIQVDRRDAFARLGASRVLRPVDDAPVFSVACFLVDRRYRRRGVSLALLREACRYAAGRGAAILEGYPIDTRKTGYPGVYAWTGFLGAFREAGFEEVARRSPTRPIMRKRLTPSAE